MTDEQDKALIDLHQKLEAKDAAFVELKDRFDKQSTWWKNPAMLTALLGMMAGAGTTMQSIYSQWSKDRKEELAAERQEHKDEREAATNKTAYSFLMKRQASMEQAVNTIASIVVSNMTPSQQAKIVDQIRTAGLPDLKVKPTQVTTESTSTPAAASEEIYTVIQQKTATGQAVNLDALEEKFVQSKK